MNHPQPQQTPAKVASTLEVAELVSAGVKVIGHAPSVPESVGETV